MTALEQTTSEVTPPQKNKTLKKKPSVKRFWHHSVQWLRRIHLYSGLFMLPWVLLYGFTGWFFNHPRYFTGDEYHAVDPTSIPDSKLAALPNAELVAAQAVDEINLASFMVGGPEVKLAANPKPSFSGYLVFNANGENQTHVIVLDPTTGVGEVRTTQVPPKSSESNSEPNTPIDPLADLGSIEEVPNPQSVAADAIPHLLEELGLEAAEAFPRRSGVTLSFDAEIDGEQARVNYNFASGAVSAKLADSPGREIATKSFLQRLHLSRGYAPSMGVKTWWAISVDAMFLSMVFWGLSGVLMWWQIRKTRLLGSLVLLASLISATLLVMGMHNELSNRAGRGRGGGGGGKQVPNKTAMVMPQDEKLFVLGLAPAELKCHHNS